MVCHFIGAQQRVSAACVLGATALALGCSSANGGSGSGPTDGGSSEAGASTPRHLTGLASGNWIESLAYSPDGSELWAASEATVGGSTGETMGWTVSGGAMVASSMGPSWSVAVAPTGSDLAVGGPAVTVVEPHGTSLQSVMTLMGASGAVGYSHDGKWVAAAAPATCEVIVYSTADGSVVSHVAHPTVTNERIWRVTFSADDSMLATASGQNGLGSPHGSTYVWKTSDWSQLTQITCTTFDAAFSSDGTQLALACWVDAKIITVSGWSVAHDIELPYAGNAMGVAFSPDGSKLAVGVFEGGALVYSSKDASTLATLTDATFTTMTPTVKGLAFSPDGTAIAGGGWDDSIIRVWTGGF